MGILDNLLKLGAGIGLDLSSGYHKPPKPNFSVAKSPNFRAVEGARKVTCIVLHATATGTLKSPLQWLCNPESKVSAHFLVHTNGDIYQLVAENNIAWHAGVSEWKGKPNVNDFSIGIELVNANDGISPYPDEQKKACAGLVAYLMDGHGVGLGDVVRHADIAPGRKNDPFGLDMDDMKRRIQEAFT